VSRLNDITNHKYNLLNVLYRCGTDNQGEALWFCKCDCGNETVVRGRCLRKSITKSCGCLRRKHGHYENNTPSPEYTSWTCMLSRCHYNKATNYANYGGRGILVCDSWRNSFQAFFSDMGYRPSGMTIDRIDNDGPYSPDNCKWSTHSEQKRNTCRTRFLTLNGETMCVTDWAIKLRINRNTVYGRLGRGWSDEKALTFNPKKRA
jgi:hypothetical protein